MHRRSLTSRLLPLPILVLVATTAAAGETGKPAPSTTNWPQWRGPLMNGVAPTGDPPITWSESRNVRWKVPIPGAGLATPIIWGDRVFLLTAIYDAPPKPIATPDPAPTQPASAPTTPGAAVDGKSAPSATAPSATATTAAADVAVSPGDRRRSNSVVADRPVEFVAMALDRNTGKLLWQKTLRRAKPHEGTHGDGSWAAASPATDGQVLIAHFGSNGTYALDLDGKLLWEHDLGDMETRAGFGEGSSPLLHGDHLLINWDHEGRSFLTSLERTTGKTNWLQPRDAKTSWSTPMVAEVGGKSQVVINGSVTSSGYELATGKPVWQSAGMTENAVPTPVLYGTHAIVMSGFRGAGLQAIDLATAAGDVSDKLAWRRDSDTPYVPSPLLYGDRLYFVKGNNAILTALDAKTGELHYGPERLDPVVGVYASLVGAAGRVYIAGRNGATAVVKAANSFEVLAVNQLDDRFDASPAIAGRDLFLRGRDSLYCLRQPD